MVHYVLLVFGIMVDNSSIEKLTEPFFPGKFIFAHILAKRTQNGPQIGFFGFLVFLGISLKWKLLLLFIFHQQMWENFGSRVMGQNAASQSNCRIL